MSPPNETSLLRKNESALARDVDDIAMVVGSYSSDGDT
jgi:hypothetical protein